ncbi:MAG: TonB-dependent receptor [Sphingomicrobium sp.]
MRVRSAERIIAFALLLALSTPAAAAPIPFDIRADTLGQALIALGQQAHITIGLTDPQAAATRSRAVHGRMELRQALTKLLAGTGYTFIIRGGAVRIVRAVAERPHPMPSSPKVHPARPVASEEIIVSASKQHVALTQFGGTVQVIELSRSDLSRVGAQGSEAILARLPVLASTSLGPGRDKLYIRGVADSSFNGPSQSIVGLYLGDVRLTYNAPDPDLSLYDMDRVELLEGPQGTLYGNGSLGGILRLVPKRPDFAGVSGFASAGGVTTSHGGTGGDASGMLNLPLVANKVVLRAVSYASRNPGYIDDIRLDRRDINRTDTVGGRAALRIDPGDDWDIEIGVLAQGISGRDGQYALSTLPPLKRAANFAQPFDNDYRLGSITVRKQLHGMELVSATSLVQHDLETRFDATGFPGTSGPQLFVEDLGITMISHETRLSRANARDGGWVGGVSLVHDIGDVSRKLGPANALVSLSRLRNVLTEAAVFGQYSHPLTPRLLLTVGGRMTYNREAGGLVDEAADMNESKRESLRFTPSAAMTFQLARRSVAYVRFAQADRAGGLAISDGGTVRRFETDSLTSMEAGIRLGQLSRERLAFSASVSHARWKDVQADLIDPAGLPFTANLGDGRINGFEMEAAWRPVRELTFELATFVNESSIHTVDSELFPLEGGDLPNIADAGARGSVQFQRQLGPGVTLGLTGSVRYVGKSRLAVGDPLNLKQGGYAQADVGARLDLGRIGVSLDVTNAADVRGNRFSLGNPFSVTQGNQLTPLRPRTLRLGVDATF